MRPGNWCEHLILRCLPTSNHLQIWTAHPTCNSSSVMFSPSSLATRLRFLKEILPVSSSSNNLKAFRISSCSISLRCRTRQQAAWARVD